MKITHISTIEEYWPGQKEDLRTARIEIWTDDPGQHFPMEVGRITATREVFDMLDELIIGCNRLLKPSNWKEHWEL